MDRLKQVAASEKKQGTRSVQHHHINKETFLETEKSPLSSKGSSFTPNQKSIIMHEIFWQTKEDVWKYYPIQPQLVKEIEYNGITLLGRDLLPVQAYQMVC